MNESNGHQLLCVASIDLACLTGVPDEEDESLSMNAKLVGPDGWAGLLEAANLREGDDQDCDGYVLKAWAIDPTTGMKINFKSWTDLCSDQVERIYGCFALNAPRPVEGTLGTEQ